MMNSYSWCVEAVPALRYPAGLSPETTNPPSPLSSDLTLRHPFPSFFKAIAMSIADAQAAAAAAASGGDGEVAVVGSKPAELCVPRVRVRRACPRERDRARTG